MPPCREKRKHIKHIKPCWWHSSASSPLCSRPCWPWSCACWSVDSSTPHLCRSRRALSPPRSCRHGSWPCWSSFLTPCPWRSPRVPVHLLPLLHVLAGHELDVGPVGAVAGIAGTVSPPPAHGGVCAPPAPASRPSWSRTCWSSFPTPCTRRGCRVPVRTCPPLPLP